MRMITLVLNLAMACFTMLVLLTDGVPASRWYQLLSLLLLAIPVMTAQTLWKLRTADAVTAWERRYVGGLNVLLLVLIGAALADQHPHPNEAGCLPYAVLACLAPALGAWVLLRPLRKDARAA